MKRWHSWTPRPLREHLLARKLERELAALSDEYTSKLEKARSRGDQEVHDYLVHDWVWNKTWRETELGRIRTDKLVRRAERRGIDLRAKQDWWTEKKWDLDEDEMDNNQVKVLTESGLAQAKRLIRNDFRQSVKWWVEVVGQVAVALTGLGGIVIGILSLLNLRLVE